MDEDDNELSDISNDVPEVEEINHSNSRNIHNNTNAIVTCTVTTGLSTSPNGINNGGGSNSKLGFTISIPSSSFTSPLTTLTSQNGTTFSSKTSSTATSTLSLDKGLNNAASTAISEQFPTSYATSTASNIKLALVAHDQPHTVQDVDENYDDC